MILASQFTLQEEDKNFITADSVCERLPQLSINGSPLELTETINYLSIST